MAVLVSNFLDSPSISERESSPKAHRLTSFTHYSTSFITFAGNLNLLSMRTILFALIMGIGLSAAAQQKKETLVIIKTSYGNITAKLYNETPKHRDNFIKLVKEGWYNDSPFHRVIKNFMIQGGGNKDGNTDPGYTVDAEFRPQFIHKKGALSAARMGDQVNPEKKSSGSQFYIVQGQIQDANALAATSQRTGVVYTDEQKKAYATVGGTPHLDGGYTVFGEVIDGMDVIDKIAAVQTGKGDKPVNPVTMRIEILK
jgi:peptidyl-prolyl cis-trans isomerase B (cyclophilin B)